MLTTTWRLLQQYGPLRFSRGVLSVLRGERHTLIDDIPRGNGASVMSHGAKFSVRPGTADQAIVDETRCVYLDLLRAHGLTEFGDVLDVGAHIGGFSIQLAQHFTIKGRINAFEPEQHNFQLLRENIELNGLSDKITPVCAAVSDRAGSSSLAVCKTGNTGGNHLASGLRMKGDYDVATVDALPIFSACQPHSLLKIDIEGIEFVVFRRVQRHLDKFDVIVGELHSLGFCKPKDSVKILRNAGFKVELRGDPRIPAFIPWR